MIQLGRVVRVLALSLLVGMPWAGGGSGTSLAQLIDYDIVYVRQPRYGDTVNTTWPEVSHPAEIDPGADLMLLHPDGSEEVLVDTGGVSSVTDPFVSFDGKWVYYSLFYDPRQHQHAARPVARRRRHLSHPSGDQGGRAAHLRRVHPQHRRRQLRRIESAQPGLGVRLSRLRDSQPRPGPGRRREDRVHQQSQRLRAAAAATRARPCSSSSWTKTAATSRQIAPMNIGSALHPTPLQDGRLMFSTRRHRAIATSACGGSGRSIPTAATGRRWSAPSTRRRRSTS